MNLAPCPDCGNQCSLLATVCPKCGRPFQPGDLKATDPPRQSAEERAAQWTPEWEKESLKTPLRNSGAIGGLIAAVLIIILIIFCCLIGRNSNSKADCERERLKENQRRYDEGQRNQNSNPTYVGPCE